MIVAVDQAENIHDLSQAMVQAGSTIHLLVEVDVGMHRCGVPTAEAALALAEQAVQLPGLHFSGVMGYEGHTVFEADVAQRKRNVEQAMSMLVGAAELIRQEGLQVEIVSAGSTSTFNQTGVFPGVTEIQAGSYIFMDTKYSGMGLPFRCALSVLATVISMPVPERAILDAGMKVLTTDNGMPELVAPAGIKLVRFSEEHGKLEVDPNLAALHVGDRLELIPSHVCTTVNLHDRYYVLRGDKLDAIWPVTGRGKSQ
jgi:D-serine deaminase-like pyridoxal phosphate-dependent protein